MDYHQARFQDVSLMVYKSDRLVAIFPANITNNTVISHQGLSYGGLLILDTLKFRDYVACFKSILNYYREKGIKNLKIKQLPKIYNIIPNGELDYLMGILGATLWKRETLSVIAMENRPQVSKDRMAGYKRALKRGLRIQEESHFGPFWQDLLIPNLAKKHQVRPVHTLEEISYLHRYFPKKIRQFNVYDGAALVAGTTIFESKQVAHSQYIASSSERHKNGSLDFLHLHLLNTTFKQKTYFDLGNSNKNDGRHINHGLQYWKEGLGARTITQDFYDLSLDKIHKLDTLFV